ncbi:MAG: ribosome assembly RNA-binding protein YhbY [Xanthomonadaceae bacterium]|nr:ribosome assembly RNA-binding protein YhbY [Xanthomonadaceae bacterium]
MALTSSQIRYLRGLAHPLKPVVMLGGKGVTAGVLKELDQALDDHELIKVRLSGGDRTERANELDRLIGSSHAETVQTIGHIAVLYRRNHDKPQIALPK